MKIVASLPAITTHTQSRSFIPYHRLVQAVVALALVAFAFYARMRLSERRIENLMRELTKAIKENNPDKVEVIIKNAPENTIRPRSAQLLVSAIQADTKIVGLLLNRGADINVRLLRGESILGTAIMTTSIDPSMDMIEFLLQQPGIDVNRGEHDATSLQLVTRYPDFLHQPTQKLAVLKLLLAKGANPNCRTRSTDWPSPLLELSRNWRPNISKENEAVIKEGMQLLLKANAKLWEKEQIRQDRLHLLNFNNN